MRYYVNLETGEIIKAWTLGGARRYFKKDAKKRAYFYAKWCIMSLSKYNSVSDLY